MKLFVCWLSGLCRRSWMLVCTGSWATREVIVFTQSIVCNSFSNDQAGSPHFCQHWRLFTWSTDMDLDNLKYNELQKLAKSAGIKANMKVFVSKICWNIFFDEYDQHYSTSVVPLWDNESMTMLSSPKVIVSVLNHNHTRRRRITMFAVLYYKVL